MEWFFFDDLGYENEIRVHLNKKFTSRVSVFPVEMNDSFFRICLSIHISCDFKWSAFYVNCEFDTTKKKNVGKKMK